MKVIVSQIGTRSIYNFKIEYYKSNRFQRKVIKEIANLDFIPNGIYVYSEETYNYLNKPHSHKKSIVMDIDFNKVNKRIEELTNQ